MPSAASLAVDKEQVRAIAVQVGVREAARQCGLSEDTVKSWSKREGWLKEKEQIAVVQEQAIQRKRINQGLHPIAPKPADVLKKYDGQTRMGIAKGLMRGAKEVGKMKGAEVVMAAQQVSSLAKAAALVHGWAVNVTNTVRLDVLASGAGDSAPVIDV
jgi:hypothetical protein